MKIEEVDDNVADLSAQELLALGDACFVDEDFAASVDAYAGALSVANETDGTLKFRALSHRSAAFYRLGRYVDALGDTEEALEVLSSAGNNGIAGLRSGESEICHKRAGVAAMNMQDYKKAKTFFEQAQQLATLNRGDEKAYKSYVKQCDYNLKPKQTTIPVPSGMPEMPSSATPASEAKAPAATKPAAKVVEKAAAPKPKAAPKPAPATPSKPANPNKQPVLGMPKYQYYQNDKFVKVEILEVNVQPENLDVQFEETHLTVKLNKNGHNYIVISGDLYNEVDVEGCKTLFKGEKVLIKLKKKNVNFEWQELLSKKLKFSSSSSTPNETGETKQDDNGNQTKPPAAATPPLVDSSKPRPYASHKDWDKIERELKKEEEEEKPEGDAAMNKLFQTIYASADDETKKAMVKSYQTSGGTVLSTNWDEVKEKDYEKERTAPKGVEWKNWDGKKLPMKEDD